MNYPKGNLYLKKVEKTVEAFVTKHELIKAHNVVVAVSGGVDSICLAHILKRCGYSIEFLYINHGTRATQNTEQKLVKKTAEHLGVKCTTFKIKNLKTSNFENSARTERQKIYRFMAQDKNLVALGHHIDDSFEWSLMQKSKSSNLIASIGIPLKNKFIIRPLMCLSKNQIRRYASIAGIQSLEDPTNNENRYERNYYRNKVIPLIAKRNPQYLKHYVNQQNELVKYLNLGLNNTNVNFSIDFKPESVLIYSLDRRVEIDSINSLIVKAVKHLSSRNRGSLNVQIKKIKQALLNHKFGPLLLTDGINAYVSTNSILLTKKKAIKTFRTKTYKNLSLLEFKVLLKDQITQHERFPHWVKLDSKARFIPLNKRVYPFNKNSSLNLVDKKIPHQNAFKILLHWDTDNNCNKKLDLTF